MTAKEFLNQARYIDKRINSKLDQVQSLRALAVNANATLSHAPGADSPDPHRMENIVARLVELESEIDADIDTLISVRREVMAAIRQMADPGQQLLLELRYLNLREWDQIAAEMRCSIRRVYQLHAHALKEYF